MSLLSGLSRLWRRRTSLPGHRSPGRRITLQLEALETREVPAAAALDTYVATLYQGFLGRTSDPGGLRSWVASLDAGASRPQVAANLLTSPEAHARWVQIAYQVFLNRPPDQAALNWWGTILEQGGIYEQVKAGVLGSAEYYSLVGGTNFSFLNAVYAQALNRPLDEAGRVFWGTALAQGVSREQVAFQLLVSAEAQQVKVASTYLTILGRPLDPVGSTFWVNALVNGARNEDLFGGVVGSDEFFVQLTTSLTRTGLGDPNAAANQFLTDADRFDITRPGAELLNRNIGTDPTAAIRSPGGAKPSSVLQVVRTVPILAPFFITPFVFYPPPVFAVFSPFYSPGFGPLFAPGFGFIYNPWLGPFYDPLLDPFFSPGFIPDYDPWFDPWFLEPGVVDPGFVDPGFFDPGFVDPGFFDPGFVDPGFVDPGFFDPGFVDPGFVDPGFVDPGFVDPGFFDPGFGGFDFGFGGFF